MTDNSLFAVLIIFGAVDLFALAVYLIFRFQNRKRREIVGHYGDHAEHLVQDYIHEHFPDAFLLNDLYFATDRGLTQIDHILICAYGVYIIETKSHNGRITIHEQNWTQEWKDKNISFHNPVKQNAIHIKALKKVLAADEHFARYRIGAVVVFTSKNVTFSEHVRGVVRLNRLAEHIRRNPQVRSGGKMALATRKKLKDLILAQAVTNTRRQEKHKSELHNQYSGL